MDGGTYNFDDKGKELQSTEMGVIYEFVCLKWTQEHYVIVTQANNTPYPHIK